MYSNGLYPLITKPTRITEKSATLIDNIFTNECQVITKSGVLICDVSDHLPVFQICRYYKNENNQNFTYKRNLTEDSINNFVNEISNVDWNEVTQELNPNSAYNVFIDKICKAYNKCCPLKKIKVKNKVENKPWLTQGLINATKKKRLLYEQSIRYGTKKLKISIKGIRIN